MPKDRFRHDPHGPGTGQAPPAEEKKAPARKKAAPKKKAS